MEVNTQRVTNRTSHFQLSFNGLLKIDFQGSRITSDGSLVLVRELDEHLMDHRRLNSRLQRFSQVSA